MATTKFKPNIKEYPVDAEGKLAYATYDANRPDYKMVPNDPFLAEMTFDKRVTGSYSKCIHLTDNKGVVWRMRDAYIEEFLMNSVYGTCYGRWAVHVFNGHFYIRLVESIRDN